MYEFDLSKWDYSEQSYLSNRFKMRLLLFVTLLCCLVYIPLTVLNFYAGVYSLCAFNLCYLLSLCSGTAYVFLLKKALPLQYLIVILVFLVLSSTAPIYYFGLVGVLWCFPIILAIFFLFPFYLALACNFCMVLSASLLAYGALETAVFVRAVIALVASFSLSGVFSFQIQKMQFRLKRLSSTDPMTGAYNRRMMDEVLQDSVAQYSRYQTLATIAIFDLDHFKTVNDKLGHLAGDRAVVELVELLRTNTRSVDYIFRLGGDEVLLLLRNISDQEAIKVIEKTCQLIARDPGIPTTASVGAAPTTLAEDVETWIKIADEALYEAKRKGRNRVELAKGWGYFAAEAAS